MEKPKVTPELWWKVYDRDQRRCIAPQLDPSVGPCTDQWGNPVVIRRHGTIPYQLTFAHIKDSGGGPRIHDERHAVMACWGHHVMGKGPDAMWVTSRHGLALIRKYLKEKYPHG